MYTFMLFIYYNAMTVDSPFSLFVVVITSIF